METDSKQTGDKLSQAIGRLGKWHLLLLLLLSIPAKLSISWTLLGIIFLAPKTHFVCVERTNSSEEISNSTCYSDCVKYQYFTDFESTIISQWDLICERAWMVNFTQTVLMFGVVIGSMVFGFVADSEMCYLHHEEYFPFMTPLRDVKESIRYGRRLALIIVGITQLVISLALPFSPNYWVFNCIRMLQGACVAGLLAVAYVLAIEIIGPTKREIVASFFHIPFAIGQIILPLFSYYLRSWNRFSLGVAIPNLLFLLYLFFVPESPKWLISMGRLEEASQIMEKAATFNNRPPQDYMEVAKNIAKEQNTQTKSDKIKLSYFVLITHPTLRLRNLCSCISWFILGVSLYGGNQYIGQTSSNAFLSIMLAGAFQIPGMLSCGYLHKRFGRRPAVVGFFLGCAVCNSLLALPDEWFYLKLVSSAVAISCTVSAFTIMYTYTSELFPTLARNMAMGASSTASRVGSMVAPFIAGLDHASWLPPAIFAAAPLLAAGICCCLPETKGKKLTDTLQEEIDQEK